MWDEYIFTTSIEETLDILEKKPHISKIIAGGTDLILEMERGIRSGISILIDVHNIPELGRIYLDQEDNVHIGAAVTHNQCLASDLIRYQARPLYQACLQIGSPQIRNMGTVAGNLITASPANDTISPLMALDAKLVIQSKKEKRTVNLNEFYTGVRKTLLRSNEMVIDIFFPAMKENQRGSFVKHSLRKAQAISLVNLCVIVTISNDNIVQHAAITLGAVAPTIVHAREAEEYLIGEPLEESIIHHTADLATRAIRPIDDIRSSAEYRRLMVKVNTQRTLVLLSENKLSDSDENPVLLQANHPTRRTSQYTRISTETPIEVRVNHQDLTFYSCQGKSLLHLLRNEAGLTGTKEGCGEGECGACTVFLDGNAVMSCLVPAPRAHKAEIITIEGLAQDDLHPVQKAFIQAGAVQCGYCTPGFVMSAAKLIEENENPSENQINAALSGNLCRCTGYYKIIRAVELALNRR